MTRNKLLIPLYAALISLFFTGVSSAESRKWTSSKGKEIDAELVDYDGTTATLRMKGKSYPLPIEKLSEADQVWLKDWKESRDKENAKNAESERESLKLILGLRKNVAIEHRYAADTAGYFQGPYGKGVRDFYDNTRSIVDIANGEVFMDCAESVAWKDHKALVFCPPSYTGSQTPHGVYINISAGSGPLNIPKGLEKTMEEISMIYASPAGTSNKCSDMRRIALVLDTLATLRKTYKIDDTRIFVGGVSGGGAISVLMALNYPEIRGAMCQVRNFIIPHPMCMPYVDNADVKKIARRKQAYAWITGEKDSNYKAIVGCAGDFKEQGFVSKLFDVPGMGHGPSPAKDLGDALRWAESASTAPAM